MTRAPTSKRTVVAEAILDDAIAQSAPPPPNERPAETPRKRVPLPEQAWVTEYRAHNDRLAAAAELLAHAWEPRERVALLRRVRTIAVGCPDKAAIMIALDEMIDAMGYSESADVAK